MKYLKSFVCLLFLTHSLRMHSQEVTSVNTYAWLAYLTQSKVSEKVSIWNDAHWVPESFILVRTGGTLLFKDKLKTTSTLGCALAWFYPPEGNSTFRPEFRLWGQTTISHDAQKFVFYHRLRYEARFRGVIEDDYLLNEFNFNYRIRYLFQTKYFFDSKKEGKYYIVASDELLFNAGEEIMNGFRLDQNRITLGGGYQIKNMSFQLGYMNQMVKSNTDDTFKMNHNIQLFVFHNFDFTSKKTTPKK